MSLIQPPVSLDGNYQQPFRPKDLTPAFILRIMVQLTQEPLLVCWTEMVQEVRNKAKDDKEVVLHYEDQLTNEWQSVFNHALGIKSVTTPMGKPFNPTPLKCLCRGLWCWIPQSLCFPVLILFLFTAMHWLSAFLLL
jgi:hypothetical protein